LDSKKAQKPAAKKPAEAEEKPAAKPTKAKEKPAAKSTKAKEKPAAKPAKAPTRRPRAAKRSRDAKPASKRGRSPPVAERARAAWASVAKAAGPTLRRARTSSEKRAGAALASLVAGLKLIAGFVLGGLQEIGSAWMRTAEIAGAAVLWVERSLRPYLIAAMRALQRALRFAERVVTPERTAAFVVVCAAIILAASQFVDYRGVEIGAPAYADVAAVAPAPQTDVETTGSVHGYAMVPVAVIVIAAALLALRGRWRVARVIPVLGALAIAVSLLLDARKGLQEGENAIAYQGAHAVLNEGFWLQLSSAAVLVVCGLLLARYAHARAAPVGRRERDKRRPRRRLRTAGVRA
jgi:hypothetical protein